MSAVVDGLRGARLAGFLAAVDVVLLALVVVVVVCFGMLSLSRLIWLLRRQMHFSPVWRLA